MQNTNKTSIISPIGNDSTNFIQKDSNIFSKKSRFDIPPNNLTALEGILQKFSSSTNNAWIPATDPAYTNRLHLALQKNFEYIERKDKFPELYEASKSSNNGPTSAHFNSSQLHKQYHPTAVATPGIGIEIVPGLKKPITQIQPISCNNSSSSSSSSSKYENLRVYVTGLPLDITNEDLDILFSSQGKIKKIKIYEDAEGKKKGDALITYVNTESPLMACHKLNNLDIGDGCIIKVTMAEYKSSSSDTTKSHLIDSSSSSSSNRNIGEKDRLQDESKPVVSLESFVLPSSSSSTLHTVYAPQSSSFSSSSSSSITATATTAIAAIMTTNAPTSTTPTYTETDTYTDISSSNHHNNQSDRRRRQDQMTAEILQSKECIICDDYADNMSTAVNRESLQLLRTILPRECYYDIYPVVMLIHVYDPAILLLHSTTMTEDEIAYYLQDLQADILIKCCQYGKVKSVYIPIPSLQSSPSTSTTTNTDTTTTAVMSENTSIIDTLGSVLVTFYQKNEAIACGHELHHRKFDNHILSTIVFLPNSTSQIQTDKSDIEHKDNNYMITTATTETVSQSTGPMDETVISVSQYGLSLGMSEVDSTTTGVMTKAIEDDVENFLNTLL